MSPEVIAALIVTAGILFFTASRYLPSLRMTVENLADTLNRQLARNPTMGRAKADSLSGEKHRRDQLIPIEFESVQSRLAAEYHALQTDIIKPAEVQHRQFEHFVADFQTVGATEQSLVEMLDPARQPRIRASPNRRQLRMRPDKKPLTAAQANTAIARLTDYRNNLARLGAAMLEYEQIARYYGDERSAAPVGEPITRAVEAITGTRPLKTPERLIDDLSPYFPTESQKVIDATGMTEKMTTVDDSGKKAAEITRVDAAHQPVPPKKDDKKREAKAAKPGKRVRLRNRDRNSPSKRSR
ncbi:hypothetical protein [Streptomonospora litoralis]|uniref:Uncharacterized protein n=1 Tax=Streptomonospora litoralis TaxID=2498135 RepID=A0A4P6Q6D4_9ACTN|nr:hypothetical protein [Streptomonospora litoralis]QBI56328.1 hypothetical protein EKD16_22875 [Streptomonospora litoralis]